MVPGGPLQHRPQPQRHPPGHGPRGWGGLRGVRRTGGGRGVRHVLQDPRGPLLHHLRHRGYPRRGHRLAQVRIVLVVGG